MGGESSEGKEGRVPEGQGLQEERLERGWGSRKDTQHKSQAHRSQLPRSLLACVLAVGVI